MAANIRLKDPHGVGDDAIHEVGVDAHGNQVSNGRYAVAPSGHLILVPPNAPIKSGFRLATEEDIAEKEALEAARQEVVQADDSEADDEEGGGDDDDEGDGEDDGDESEADGDPPSSAA